MNVPASTRVSVYRAHSSSEPSAKTTWFGWVSSAISSTQDNNAGDVPCGAPMILTSVEIGTDGISTGASAKLETAGWRITAVTCTISWNIGAHAAGPALRRK